MKKTLLRFSTIAIIGLTTVTAFDSCKSGPKDADIETSIAAKTNETPALTATVKDGVATLSGMAKNEEEKTQYEGTVKSIEGVKSVVNNITVAPPAPTAAPVEVATADALTTGVTDATKDFPTVTATVADGVVTLNGELERSKLKQLMERVQSLKPKKVENKLKLK
ncbi:MAG: BON domain-containing protein [Chitinophagaceae bacterium]|nr:MAG: BON domain-containing protein [Chitinophagaceae bacterium]